MLSESCFDTQPHFLFAKDLLQSKRYSIFSYPPTLSRHPQTTIAGLKKPIAPLAGEDG